MALRSPIVSVLGHVDHGKSSILDAIRGSNILATEAGAITQAIGASIIPIEVIKKKAGPLLEALKMQLTIPGLLFIDTPGHAAFTSLRKRGGALADIAIVVVDINEGFKPQTIETIEILRNAKTPFLVAANKIDLIAGYRKRDERVLKDINMQDPAWIQSFETKMYEIVGQLHERFGMGSERFDRVESFTKQIAIVPTSAQKGHGISELLMVLAGLAQKFLEEGLRFNVEGPGRATILEVKETTGFGLTLDIILYDGTIRRNDTVVIGTLDEPIVTKVRALLEPAPLQEMRDKKSKYTHLQEASAATGLKLAAPGMEGAIAGMPVRVVGPQDDKDAIVAQMRSEIQGSLIETDEDGILIKADTIGSLEALTVLLREKEIQVRKAGIGPISKKDLIDAQSSEDPKDKAILGFNIPAETSPDVKIFTSDIIYRLIDDLEAWRKEVEASQHAEQLSTLTRPCKLEILQNCIFRQSNPCVAGVEVLAGSLKVGTALMNKEGKRLTNVHSIQHNKESVAEAKFGEQVALSLPHVMAGRHVNEHDILYSQINEETFRELKEYKNLLTPQEKDILKEIAEIFRKENPLWGI